MLVLINEVDCAGNLQAIGEYSMSMTEKFVFVATPEELQHKEYREHLQQQVLSVNISQRDWPTKIQDALLYADMASVQIWQRWDSPPLVDDVWNDNERYIREFLASKECLYPERDRLIDLYFKLMLRPEIIKRILQ